jgi:hypothetical protein
VFIGEALGDAIGFGEQGADVVHDVANHQPPKII